MDLDTKYYDLIDSSGYQLIVFGEEGEQWTDEVLKLLEDADVKFHFFSWSLIPELRLQFEILHYPITQLWYDGNLKVEFTGYHNEALKDILMQIKF